MTGKKVSTFKERLAQAIVNSGKSQTTIAIDLGVSKQAVSTWVNGSFSPKKPTIVTLAAYFGVSIEWLMGFDVPEQVAQMPNKDRDRDIFSYKNVLPVERFTVPMLGSVAAGKPIYDQDDFDTRIPVGSALKCDFALQVKGDSMEPGIKDGDIVLVQDQQDVLDGRIAVVVVGDEVTLKHVYRTRNGVTLVSDNAEYPPMVFSEDECDEIRIMGKPVAYLRGM